jgi:hypothetical protein
LISDVATCLNHFHAFQSGTVTFSSPVTPTKRYVWIKRLFYAKPRQRRLVLLGWRQSNRQRKTEDR